MRILWGCRKLFGIAVFACIAIFVLSLFGGNRPSGDSLPTLAVLPSLTWTPETVAVQMTDTAGVTIIPTVVRVSSGFVTITPAPGTVYPTATITDTPLPTATNTIAPTSTAMPTGEPTTAIRAINSLTYYVTRTANMRSCANSSCKRLGQVTAGTRMTVVGITDGETVTGSNSTWYQVQYGGDIAYIYSAFLTDVAPAPTQQPIIVQQPAPVQEQPASVPQVQPPAAPQVDSSNGATALCNDGTYSYAAHHQGACSHHGGVAVFYK